MSKQDRQGVRTVNGLEQKYGFGKTFAEIEGIATDARTKAEEVEKKINGDMTNEEIFNMLTQNGANQGLFRLDDGQLYINAEYIQVIDALFANNINMSGTFTYKTKVFLEPGQEEIDAIKKHILGTMPIIPSRIYLYDTNGDGVVNAVDLAAFKMALLGERSLADWSGAVKSDVTLTIDFKNPNKAFRMQGRNMWGRDIDVYIGMNQSHIISDMQDYIVDYGTLINGNNTQWSYEKYKSGKCVCRCRANNVYGTPTTNFEENYRYQTVLFPFEFKELPYVNISYSATGEPPYYTGNVKTSVLALYTNQADLCCSMLDSAEGCYINAEFIGELA